MSQNSIVKTNQFEIQSLVILSPNQKIEIDIRSIFEELNIHDSVLLNTISGDIIITDSIGVLKGFEFDGFQYLYVEMSKTEDKRFSYKKLFHIYKQSLKYTIKPGAVSYRLNFISDEYTTSEQTKVAQHYQFSYSKIAQLILKDHLKIQKEKFGQFSDSQGIRSVIIPTMTPLDAITWCSKRALDVNDKPTFLFFENSDGFNFMSLNDIFKQTPLHDINISPKNIVDNMNIELFGTRNYELIDQYDFIQNVTSGVFAKTGRFYDILNRTFREIKSDYFKDQIGLTSLNPQKNAPPAKVNVHNLRPEQAYQSKYVSYYYNSNPKGNEESPEKWLLQREAIFQNLFAKRIRIEMSGLFTYTSGKLLKVFVPNFSVSTKQDEGLNQFLTGNYMIIATQHKLRAEGQEHTTIMDLVSDSTINIK
jgi:hypothetical protein